jgi:hypothetical protein
MQKITKQKDKKEEENISLEKEKKPIKPEEPLKPSLIAKSHNL